LMCWWLCWSGVDDCFDVLMCWWLCWYFDHCIDVLVLMECVDGNLLLWLLMSRCVVTVLLYWWLCWWLCWCVGLCWTVLTCWWLCWLSCPCDDVLMSVLQLMCWYQFVDMLTSLITSLLHGFVISKRFCILPPIFLSDFILLSTVVLGVTVVPLTVYCAVMHCGSFGILPVQS
jgi:hypothetical protein